MVEGGVSHGRIARFLSEQDYPSKDLWQQVKPAVRTAEREDGAPVFDGTVQEKARTDESGPTRLHYDPRGGRNVGGINLPNALYHRNGTSVPAAFEPVKKPVQYRGPKTRQVKRPGGVTKNGMMCQMIGACPRNAPKFRSALMGSRFSPGESSDFIAGKGGHSIAAPKGNRLLAPGEEG
ncbi:MAG: IS701 family transposase, partial [Betaproteobacteria bacterium]|nr:IS701 family transposase [Betaproteobacteria bacterium]